MNKYGARLLSLPASKLVVFHNVSVDRSDESVLRLSDSFPKGAASNIEVRVRMVNVNEVHSRE